MEIQYEDTELISECTTKGSLRTLFCTNLQQRLFFLSYHRHQKIFLDSRLYFYLLRCGAECKCLLGEFVQNILFKPSQRETPLSWGKCNISFLLTLPIITIIIIIIFFFNDVITNKEYHPLYLARANITILFANSSFSIFCRRIQISSSICFL